MTTATSAWADSWASSQKAVTQAMFPAPAQGASDAAGAKAVLQDQFAELRGTWKESMEKWTDLVRQHPKATASRRERCAP
jgi:hypothetical protein